MSDLALGSAWLGILVCGLAGAVVVRSLGLASTYVRDLLHIGAGVWVLGWPLWHGPAIPIAISLSTAIGVALVPLLARRVALADRLEHAVTGDDEHWGGLVLYTIAFAALTAIAMFGDPFPAAAGLFALSIGDGIGGLAGRKLGRHGYRAPGGKRKSLEGSLVVALGTCAGVLLAGALFHHAIGVPIAIGLGVLAAVVEGISPRGTDNLTTPLAIWAMASLVT
jgi:phytol kinase